MLGLLGLSCQSIELRFRGILLFTARLVSLLVIFYLASLKCSRHIGAELYGSVMGSCVDSCLIVEVYIYTVFT
ncbi:hypothetical protein ANAPRD1_00867 [Anaplasma phagocytophilum]|nr:hypothetical protein ANAPH1_00632 [Anaplasma phagocytophilum]SCV65522.1 hypothetical protein ANAPRD1_00867 [Anaplasma phagocytophilum]